MTTLSICIATLNRSHLLGATLDSILPQLTDEVEIVIVDGASTDSTAEIVAAYQARSSRIVYERRPQNGGVDRDFCRAVEIAQGRYCWFFSDDDLLRPGAIERVLKETAAGPAMIVVNAELRNATLSKILVPNRAGVTADRSYSPDEHEQSFSDLGYYLSFIGGVVIRRSVWMEREKERYLGTEFAHIGVIFQEPLPGAVFVISDPLIVIRHGNQVWTGRTFEIWLFKWPELIASLDLFPMAVRQRVAPQRPWRNPIVLLQYRAIGAYSQREYRTFLDARLSPVRRGMARLIAAMPARVVNLASVAYCHLTGSTMALDTLRESSVYYARRSGKHRASGDARS